MSSDASCSEEREVPDPQSVSANMDGTPLKLSGASFRPGGSGFAVCDSGTGAGGDGVFLFRTGYVRCVAGSGDLTEGRTGSDCCDG